MSLRQSVLGERKKGGKGWGGNWRDRFDIPKASAEAILLTPGRYEDERPDAIKANDGIPPEKHYKAILFDTFKDSVKGKEIFRKWRCASGWDGKQGDCLGCYRKESGDKRVAKRTLFFFNMIHFGFYEKTELRDKDDKVIRYDKDGDDHKRGDPIMVWAQITRPKERKHAKENMEEMMENDELRLFRKKYVEVGSGHLDNLMQIDELASKRCRCGGHLTPFLFTCPECGEILCDVEDSNMSDEERDNYAKERQRCKACGHSGHPNMQYICDECGDEAKPLTAFDVVALIRKAGEGTNSTIVVEDIIPVFEYLLPNKESIVQWDDDGAPVADEDGYTFTDDVAKLANNQFDFEKINPPLDNEEVAKFLRVDNPFASAGASKYARTKKRLRDDDGEEKKEEEEKEEEEEEEKPARRPPPRKR
jgi:hypothetical protein